jgi:hypothetical protein
VGVSSAVALAAGGGAAHAPGPVSFEAELPVMNKVLGVIVVLLIAIIGFGFYRGWFQFEKPKSDDGKTHYGLTVDKEKFKKDRELAKKTAAEKTKALKDRIASLHDKSKGQTGEEKAKTEKEIDELSKKHETIDAKVKELEEAGEEKFEKAKKALEEHLEERKQEPPKEEKPK